MELIYYRGLNCHLASIINIAHSLGVNYLDAYATLWSEADFTDEEKYNIYMSRRVFTGLKTIGVIIEMLDRDEMKTAESLSRIPDGEMFLVGMDTFYIPWHPVFGHFHDAHYFYAQKEKAHSFLCFDPVYNEKYMRMKLSNVLSAAFEVSHVYRIDSSPPKYSVAQEARAILRSHPKEKEKLLAAILQCKGEGRNNVCLLIKQINAMINNRYLFQHFYCYYATVSGSNEHFFDGSFFLRWEAVKNGLYKASIIKDNKNVIEEVYSLFAALMAEEINMAKEIIAISS